MSDSRRPNKGQKGSTSRKEFSKSLRPSNFPIMTPLSQRSPRKMHRSSTKLVKSIEDEKTDNKYSISTDDYTVILFNKAAINRDEIITVVQKKSNKKNYLAITCKEINNYMSYDYFLNQISILLNNQHPTIAHFYGFSFNDFENKGHITFLTSHYQCVLSKFLYDKGSHVNIQGYTSTKRQITLIGIARGMQLLHERCIIHKRLNTSNIYINKNYYPKIIGFGSVKNEKDIYSAPEKTYSTKSDVFSFGILMYEVISGYKAYSRNRDQDNILLKIFNQDYRPEINFPIKNSLKILMKECWSANPNDRPDFEKIFTKLCQLDDPKSKLPPLIKIDDDESEKPKISYCLDDNVNKEEVRAYIKKILVDIKPANFGGNKNEEEEENEQIKSLKEQIEKLKEQIELQNKEKEQKNDKEKITVITKDDYLNDRENIDYIKIPDSVVIIDSNTFNGCKSLKTVDIPSSVKFIGDSSFSDCVSLEDLNMPDSVDSLGLYAFSKCKKLEKIKLSSILPNIRKGTFSYCYSLRCLEMPNSVKSLGESAFYKCKNMEKIMLSESLTKIKDDAFAECEELKFIEIPNSVSKTGSRIFCECKNLEEVILSSKIDSLKESMFLNCKSLKSIKVKEEEIETSSKKQDLENNNNSKDDSLEILNVPSTITTVEDNAFEGCNFKAIVFPSSVKMIGNNVCKGCKNLKYIKIESSKATIKQNAFSGLLSLEKIESKSSLESVKIPLSVNKINGESFFLCISCQKIIDEDDENLVQFSGFSYHRSCMNCSICHKNINKSIDIENFKYVAPGLFLCEEDYKKALLIKNNKKPIPKDDNEQKSFLEKYNAIKEEYEEKIIYISIKELFNPFTVQPSKLSDYFWLDQSLIDNSFRMNKDYQYFVPTVTFHFQNEPEKIDFLEIVSELPKEMVIISVEEGSTLLTLALIIPDKENSTDLEKKCLKIIEKFNIKLNAYVQSIGNIVDQPLLKIPNNDEMKKFSHNKYNILNKLFDLKQFDDFDKIKEMAEFKLSNERDKNMKIICNHFDIYKAAEKQVIQDIYDNKFECILSGLTIIGNKNFDQFDDIEKNINEDEEKKAVTKFLYHGTNIQNHSDIIMNHFKMPGVDQDIERTDEGYYGDGIYATNNFYYASLYQGGAAMELSIKQNSSIQSSASIFCCSTIYNDNCKYEVELNDKYQEEVVINDSEKMDYDTTINAFIKRRIDNIKNSYGKVHALVGSVNKNHSILAVDENESRISAEEFVFFNKYQIIPVMSFIVMKADFYVLWIDKKQKYMNECDNLKKEINQNIYYFDSDEDYINFIDKKIWNKMKLIISCDDDVQWGKNTINEIRQNKIESNFVCLVFSNLIKHKNSFKNIENVLFTNNNQQLINFAKMDMSKDSIKDFINNVLDNGSSFNINENSLDKFKIIKTLEAKEENKKEFYAKKKSYAKKKYQ